MDLTLNEDTVVSPPPQEALADERTTPQDAKPESMSDQDLGAYLGDYEAPKRGDISTGVIIEQNESGLIVDVGLKQEGLVPASDIDRLDEETRAGIAPGGEITVMVVRTSGREGHPILSISQARAQQDWINAEEMMKKEELWEAEVIGCNRGGLVVPFGKLRGFIPASQVTGMPRRLSPQERRERLEAMVGEQVGARIIEVDRQRRRLILSQRRALRAWQNKQRDRVMDELTEGETRTGSVTSITDFGAFVDLGGADGLIHVSELSWVRVGHPREVVKVGDEVEVYVLNIDRERKRIGLSLKRLQPDPWSLVEERYPVGSLAEGRVTRVLDFGAFVELDLGVEGLLHPTEMIGTPELSPADILEPGETVLVKILRTDARRRRIALSATRVGRDEWERWEAERQAAKEAADSEAADAAEEVAAVEAEPGQVAGAEGAQPAAEEAPAEDTEEAAPGPEEEPAPEGEAEPAVKDDTEQADTEAAPEGEPEQAAEAEAESEPEPAPEEEADKDADEASEEESAEAEAEAAKEDTPDSQAADEEAAD